MTILTKMVPGRGRWGTEFAWDALISGVVWDARVWETI